MKKLLSIIFLAMLPFFCIAQDATTTETSAPQSEVTNTSEKAPTTADSAIAGNDSSKGMDDLVNDKRATTTFVVLTIILSILFWCICPRGLVHFLDCLPSITSGQGMVPKKNMGKVFLVIIASMVSGMIVVTIFK